MGNNQSFASNKYLNTHKKEQKNKEYTSDDQDIGSSRSHSAGSNDMLKYGVKSELQSFAPAGCNADENESKQIQASREFDNSSLATSQLGAEQIGSKNKMCESQSVVYHAGNDYRKLSNRGLTPRTRRTVCDFLSNSKILELFPNGALHFRRECVIQTTNDGGAPRKVAVRTEDGRWKLNCVPIESFSFSPAGCNADENESKQIQASREFDNSSLATSQQIVSKNKMRESQSDVYHAGNDYRKLSNRGRTPRTRRKVRDFLSTSKILELFPNGALHFRRECVIQTTHDGGAPRKVAVRTEDGRWKLNCVPTKSFSGVVITEKQINELFPFGRIEFRGTVVTHTALNGETREVAIYGEDGRLILLDKVTEELDII